MAMKKRAHANKAERSARDTQSLEKVLLSMPAKVLAQLKAEVARLKQTEKKIKQNVLQLGKRIKKNMPREAAVKATKLSRAFSKELQEITKTIQCALQRQAKMLELKKRLVQFEKDWLNKSKLKTKKHKKTTRTKKTASPLARTPHHQTTYTPSMPTLTPTVIPQRETVETETDKTPEMQ